MTPDEQAAIDVARRLAETGVPIFLARPARNERGEWDPAGGSGGSGYWLPKGWENTSANPRYLEAWEPGLAVCAVMGHVLDLVDLDPRNGGDPASLNGSMPRVYGVAATPSEGYHGFVRSLGVRSRDAVLPGIDIKAGDPDGYGRGFAFIAPTIKLSKSTGAIGTYRWVEPPDFDALRKVDDDRTGRRLAELVQQAHGARRKPTQPDQEDEARDWMVAETIPRGKRYPWLRSYAGWLREKNMPLAEARVFMRRRWEACEQPADYPMPWEDAETLLEDIYGRYAAGEPISGPTVITEPEQQQEAAEAVDKFDSLYLPRSALVDLPRGEPLIEDVIDRHTLFVVAGRDQTFKSFLVLDWLACLATGRPWLGHTTEQTKVLLVVGEGAWGLNDRVAAWEAARSVDIEDEWFTVRRAPVNLFKQADAFADLLARIRDERYGVVVFDTLQRMASGADQNSARDAGIIVAALDRVRQATTNGSVGIVAHTDKGDNDTRGSSAFEDDADIVWRTKRDEDEEIIRVTLAKRKDGPDGEMLELRPEVIAGTNSLILNRTSGLRIDADRKPPKHTFDVLKILSTPLFVDDGASLTALGEALNLSGKGSVERAVNWLLGQGYVEKVRLSPASQASLGRLGRYSRLKITSQGASQLEQIGETVD